MNPSVGPGRRERLLDHPMPVEQRDTRERLRSYEHLEVVEGAGHVADPHLGVGERLAKHRGYLLIDHEPRDYDPAALRTRRAAVVPTLHRVSITLAIRTSQDMRTTDRARLATPAILAALAGTAASALSFLAFAGAHVCSHHHDAGPAGLCPTLLYGAAVAATLCLLAVVTVAASRAGAPVVLRSVARSIARLRVGPLTLGLALLGALPLAAMAAGEGLPEGAGAPVAVAALVAGAFIAALTLVGAARLVLRFAERVLRALTRAARLIPGADAPRLVVRRELVPLACGVRIARRTPSRAPPLR